MLEKVLALLDSVLAPGETRCLLCDQGLRPEDDLMICPVCAQELELLYAEEQLDETEEIPEGISERLSAFPYKGKARKLVTLLKFRSERDAGLPLAHWMSRLPLESYDLLVPVPTGKARKRERGYNQAEVLAHLLRFRPKIPVREVLRRTEERESQYKLNETERKNNLRGTFAADRRVSGKAVLVVDDICTTGATAAECARALKSAGAVRVGLLTACKTGQYSDREDHLFLK